MLFHSLGDTTYYSQFRTARRDSVKTPLSNFLNFDRVYITASSENKPTGWSKKTGPLYIFQNI